MKRHLHFLLAGAFGALANSLTVYGFGALGLHQALGFAMAPPLTAFFFLNRMFWGGLWGLVFALPIEDERPYLKGLLLSVGPSVVMCLLVFPMKGGGFLGLAKGPGAPFFVLFHNAVWGLAAAWLLLRLRGKAA